jgi:hypothetical protein
LVVDELDPEDYHEDGPAAMALCRYVKAIYAYMKTTLELAKDGVTEEAMKRQAMFHRGNSKMWNTHSLSKMKKVTEECQH